MQSGNLTEASMSSTKKRKESAATPRATKLGMYLTLGDLHTFTASEKGPEQSESLAIASCVALSPKGSQTVRPTNSRIPDKGVALRQPSGDTDKYELISEDGAPDDPIIISGDETPLNSEVTNEHRVIFQRRCIRVRIRSRQIEVTQLQGGLPPLDESTGFVTCPVCRKIFPATVARSRLRRHLRRGSCHPPSSADTAVTTANGADADVVSHPTSNQLPLSNAGAVETPPGFSVSLVTELESFSSQLESFSRECRALVAQCNPLEILEGELLDTLESRHRFWPP